MDNLAKEHKNDARPLWSANLKGETRIEKFIRVIEKKTDHTFKDYKELHDWSISRSEDFWTQVWDFTGIMGTQGTSVITPINKAPYAQFFTDSKINYTENILQHAPRMLDAPAIIGCTQDGEDDVISWKTLSEQINIWAQAFTNEGLKKGDHIAIYMPNIPQSVIVFLAAASLGIVTVSAGMEMGADDLINRFARVKPKLLITTDGYTHARKVIERIETINKTVLSIPSITHVIITTENIKNIDLQQKYTRTQDFLSQFKPIKNTYERFNFNHPLYVLFSSGTTGTPKCFEHSTGGVLLKHMVEHQLQCDVRPGDRVFYHATPSWMMWNWLISALGCGATILMYDGSPAYPTRDVQWQFTAKHKCTHHGTAAPVILSWMNKSLRPADNLNLSPLRMIMSTGAVLPEQGFEYIHEHIKNDVKISSIAGGTDIVGCFVGGNPMVPTYAGQINGPILGMDVRVWDDDGAACPVNQPGELVCTNPFPSMPVKFLDDEDSTRYTETYFCHYPGRKAWRHGDSIMNTTEGQMILVGRSDATLNQNGVRIGASAIYAQLDQFKDQITDYAAVDFTRPDNKQAITILFLVMHDDQKAVPDPLQKSVRKAIKDGVTPYAIPTEIIAVPDILKTPNGKKAEVVIKKILSGKAVPNQSLYGENVVKLYEEIGRHLQEKYT